MNTAMLIGYWQKDILQLSGLPAETELSPAWLSKQTAPLYPHSLALNTKRLSWVYFVKIYLSCSLFLNLFLWKQGAF